MENQGVQIIFGYTVCLYFIEHSIISTYIHIQDESVAP